MNEYGSIFNTSYGGRDYVVVSATPTEVVLRPVDAESSIPTYWQEFVRAGVAISRSPYTLHINNLPTSVLHVGAFADYTIEYPRVEVHTDGVVIDVSDSITSNHPNPDTPGLYAIDYMLAVSSEVSVPIWRSWVSIEEPPLLRHIITPWNRENKTIADLNRLVMEPRFNEALYEAGVPLYNFMGSNAPVAVRQWDIMKYKTSRAFVKDARLFITGPYLPVGTKVTIDGATYNLGASVMTATFSASTRYLEGDIVSYGGSGYYASTDVPLVTLPEYSESVSMLPGSITEDNLECWLQGMYYLVDGLSLADGEYTISSLWSTVDIGGYPFSMDLTRALSVQHYWGVYNRQYYMDYAPGDLVSYISNGVVSLYYRNDTPTDDMAIEDVYPPGHYKNTHWIEVYSVEGENTLRTPVIVPCTNATNAIVSKTGTIREEAFRMYSHLVGIPSSVVSALGYKYSTILWAILYRTRETFPGFRAALNAIGVDAPDLHRVYPSTVYSAFTSASNPVEVENIYTEIDMVKSIARSIKADKVWTQDGNPTTRISGEDRDSFGEIRWVRYARPGEDANTIWVYDPNQHTWAPYYSFTHIGSDLSADTYRFDVNNRYYRATITLLDRLAEDTALDLGDGIQWLDQSKVSPVTKALVELLEYEIPIYIYFRMLMSIASTGHAVLRGVAGGVVRHEAWGGSIGLKVFPGKYFDPISLTIKAFYPRVLYSYEAISGGDDDPGWTEISDYTFVDGARYYAFEQAVYLRLYYGELPDGTRLREDSGGRWVSQYTIGCLGYAASPGTDSSEFLDASELYTGMTLYLCKGIAAITLRIAVSTYAITASSFKYNYVFGSEDWTLDSVLPFASWQSTPANFYGYWYTTPLEFKAALSRCSSPVTGDMLFDWDLDGETGVLFIASGAASTVYLYDSNDNVIGMVTLGYVHNAVQDDTYIIKLYFPELATN